MAYEAVTPDDFTTRFPIFADREPEQIAAVLAEASARVDNRWRAADYKPAILYLAAHLLVTDSSQEGEEEGVGPIGAGKVIASESIAGMSTSYFNGTAGGGSSSEYDMTSYGRRYRMLLKANFGGPVIV